MKLSYFNRQHLGAVQRQCGDHESLGHPRSAIGSKPPVISSLVDIARSVNDVDIVKKELTKNDLRIQV